MATITATGDLPDSAFAYIEPGCKKTDGKTEDRCRHFPIPDAAHVRNALARLSQSQFGEKARPKVEAAAKRMGIGEPAAKGAELKAEPMTTGQLDRWLKGDIPRQILVLPFGGPIRKKGAPLGVDIDGEWFDAETDIIAGHRALSESRERVTDWHHDLDPTGLMKGAILGYTNIDEEPQTVNLDGVDYTGLWGAFWANAGEKRRALVAQLERGGVPLFGSSMAAYKRKAESGHIDTWPIIRHTITTSPQNTYAVVPALKALLTDPSFDALPAAAIKALLVDELLPDLRATFRVLEGETSPTDGGDPVAKAGRVLSARNEASLLAAIESLSSVLAQLRKDVEDQTT